MTRFASIDIGTNSVLLLVSDISSSGGMDVLKDESRITRMGEGIEKHYEISNNALSRTVTVLQEYKEICGSLNVNRIYAFATEVLRKAGNAHEVVKRIKDSTGLDVQILTGKEEAVYSYRSVLSPTGEVDVGLIAVDIGGGSTEIVYEEDKDKLSFHSLPVGAVSLSGEFLNNDPPANEEIDRMRRSIRSSLRIVDKSAFAYDNVSMVGIGGTVTTLAAVMLELDKFDPLKIEGAQLKFEAVTAIFNRFSTMTSYNRLSLKGMEKGREDIIIAGTAIVLEIMDFASVNTIMVSTKGVRYGYLSAKIGAN